MTTIPRLDDGEQRVFFKAGGEWCYLWTPKWFKKDEVIPVVIHHHGAGGFVKDGEADWLDTESKTAYLKAVMVGGRCAISGSHACGNHWGNAEAVAANAALYQVLEEAPSIDTTRTGLMGGGLGGALIWNSVLGPLAGKTRAVAVMQAVANLTAVIREQKFKAPCLKGYGLPEDTPDDEAILEIAPHDPMLRLKRLKDGTKLPWAAIYHGEIDNNIPAKTNAIPLAEALKKAGGRVDFELFPGIGHNVYGMGRTIEKKLETFFSKAL
jgi:hypothetical protein